MPRGVAGTGRWERTPYGVSYWVENPAPAPPPPTIEKAVDSLKRSQKDQRRNAGTNKYGGPKGTKRDAQGRRFSEHQGDPAAVAAAAAADAASKASRQAKRIERQAVAQAAAEKRRQEMLARLKKRALKMNKKLAGELKEIEEKRQRHLDRATVIREKIEAGTDNRYGMMGLQKQLADENRGLLALEHKEAKAYGLRRRSEGFDELQARTAVRNATNQYTGAKLGTDPNPYEQRKPEGARAEYGFGSLVRDAYEFNYKTKPGDNGHAKNIRRAMTTDFAMAAQHPEWFDTPEGAEAVNAGIFAHFEQLDEHAGIKSEEFNQKQKRQQQLQKRFAATNKRFRAGGKSSEKDYNRLLDLAKKYKQLANDPEYKKLIAEIDAIYGKTAIRPDFKVSKQTQLGLYWFYDTGVAHVYDAVEVRNNAIEAVEGNKARQALLDRDVANMESDLRRIHEEMAPQTYDPLTGEMRPQDYQAWFNKVQREGLPPEAQRMEERGWAETVDINKRALEVESDPVLSRFYRSLKAEGIETNEDLKYSANMTFVDKQMGLAVNGALDDWRGSKDFDPPGLGPKYDMSRYGEDALGEFYEDENGLVLRRGEPLPLDRFGRQHENPLWDTCSLSENTGGGTLSGVEVCSIENSFTYKSNYADLDYIADKKSQFAKTMGEETGREMRDALAFGFGSEALSSAIAIGTIPIRHIEAMQEATVGLEGDRGWTNLAAHGEAIDPHQTSIDALDAFIDSPEYVNPGVDAGLFVAENYQWDDDGIFFAYKGENGEATKVRRGDYLPVGAAAMYNGGKRMQPLWFEPERDGALNAIPMGMFESPEEYYDRLKDQPPSHDKLARAEIGMTKAYHEAFQRRAFNEAGGTNDIVEALRTNKDWELVYSGKAADAPGGVVQPAFDEDDWGLLAQAGNAVTHALSVLTGQEITVIKSMKDDRYRQESYFTLSLPGSDGAMVESPWTIMHEYGPAVGAEVDADIEVANQKLRDGQFDVYLESMNAQGMPVKFGSLAEAANFLFEMAVDVTNWIPVVNIAKRGLQGIKTAVAVGKLPASSMTARVAASVTDGVRAVRTHPDTFRMSGALAKDAENSLNMTSEEFTRFLDEDLHDILDDLNTPAGQQKAISRLVDRLAKKDPNLDPDQLHQWVEKELTRMFKQRGITVHTTPDEAARQIEMQKASTTRKTADAVEIEADIQKRAKNIAEDQKTAERGARKLERERSARRAEDLKVKNDVKAKKARQEAKFQERIQEGRKVEEARLRKEGRAGESYTLKVDKGPAVTIKAGWDKQPKAKLLADTVSPRGPRDEVYREVPTGRGGSKTVVTVGDAHRAAQAGRYTNTGPSLPAIRLRDMPKGKFGPGLRIGPADLRQNIDNALAEIAEAERKLLGKPSRKRQLALEQDLVEWKSLKSQMDAELKNLIHVEKSVAEAKEFARKEVLGTWEPRLNEDGVLVDTKIKTGEFEGEDLDVVTDLMVEQALKDGGFWQGGTKEFNAYRKWVREASHETNAAYNNIIDQLSGGKLNPNLNIEKNLLIIREMDEVIAVELAYGNLRLGLGSPSALYGKYVPGTVDQVRAILHAEDLSETLTKTSVVRRARLSEAVRQAEDAKGFDRHPYKLDAEYSKQYAPREPMGSVDEAKRAQEAEMVQQWRQTHGVATFERTVSAWRTGQNYTFPSLVAPPGSRVMDDDYLKALDAVIKGPDVEAAARAWHEKSLIFQQAWDRFHAVANGTQYPSGYQSFLSGGFREPESLGRLNAQNRAYREIQTLARMGRPTDTHYMVLSAQSDEVYLGHVRRVTVENDVRGRTAKEIAGEEYWFYADQGRGPGNYTSDLSGRGEMPRLDESLATKGDAGAALPGAGEDGVVAINIGEDLARAQADNLSNTWYQPWEPFEKVRGNPAMAANPGSTWWQLAETGRNVDFVKTMEGNDVAEWLNALDAARLDGGWDNLGAVDYRRTMQPMVDMFHGLHQGVIAGDSEAFLTLQRFHDTFVDIHRGGSATRRLDDFASTWLMMESRMGLPFALPQDYAAWNFKRMARSKGMMPERAAMMVQHKLKMPKFVGAHSDLNPSIQPLFDAGAGPRIGSKRLKNADGQDMSWNAEAPEQWLATGQTKRLVDGNAYTSDWEDAYHFLMQQDMSFDEMVHSSLALLRTNSALTGQWAVGKGGKLRAAVLERNVHEIVTRRIVVTKSGKVGFRSAEDAQAVGNLYWNDLLVRGDVPPGAIDFVPETRKFVLDDDTIRMLGGQETATLEELTDLFTGFGRAKGRPIPTLDEWAKSLAGHGAYHAKRDSYVIPESVGKNPFGASKVKTNQTYSKVAGAEGKSQPIRQAFEMGTNGVKGYKKVPASTPYEAVFHFIANRAYWTDAVSRSQGTARATWLMDQLDIFVAKGAMTADDLEMANAMVRDILGPEFRAKVFRLNEAALTGAQTGYLVRNVIGNDETFALMKRVGYGEPQKLAEKSVADAKAGRLRLKKDTTRSPLKDADEFTEADRTAAEEADRAERLTERKKAEARGDEKGRTWDEEDNGWLDLGTPGGLPARLDELEGRWKRLFEGEGGKVLPERETVFNKAMDDFAKANPEPPKPLRVKRRRVETETAGEPQALKGAKAGDTVSHKVFGDVEVVKVVDGNVTILERPGVERTISADSPVWTKKTKTAKYEDVGQTPEIARQRKAAETRYDQWVDKRDAATKEANARVRELRGGKTSVEADQLVREVIGLLTTPGHAGDGQLRIARIASEMARSAQMAEGLRTDIIEAFRSIPPIFDGGTAVWNDAYVGKKAVDGFDEALPKAPKRPKDANERIAGAGETGSPDSVDDTAETIRESAEADMKTYDDAVAKTEAETNRIIQERIVKTETKVEDLPQPPVPTAAHPTLGMKSGKPMFLTGGVGKGKVVGGVVVRTRVATQLSVDSASGFARDQIEWAIRTVDADDEFLKRLAFLPKDKQRAAFQRKVMSTLGENFTPKETVRTNGALQSAQDRLAQAKRDVAAGDTVDMAKYEENVVEAQRAHDKALADEVNGLEDEVPLPEEPAEQFLDAGDEGVRIEVDPREAALDVHQGAKMAWEAMGLSEERYYQQLIRANRAEMVRKGTSKARYGELDAHNQNLVLALRSVRRQKKKATYVKPVRKMQDAYEGATKVRDDIEGVIPDGKMAYYGEVEEAIELEHARALRVRSERAKRSGSVKEPGLPDKVMRNFDPVHWRGLNDAVSKAVRKQQPQRSGSLNMGRRADPNEVVDDVLRTNRDKDPVLKAAIEAAITQYAKDNGIEDWGVELYWRVRTLVSGSEGKMRRGIGMLETAGPDPGDFLNLRRAAADNEAFEQVKWWLYNNPHATPEEAAEYFRLTQGTSGKINDVQEVLTEADVAILDGFVSMYTKVDDVSDKLAMREALGKHMKPPMDQRDAMRAHQEKVGRWSPRTVDEVITGGAWNIDDEIEYWALNYEDLPAWVDDPRIRTGSVFHDEDMMAKMLREVGGYNDEARLTRAKSGEKNIDFDDYAYGKKNAAGEWEIKPKKDWLTQRKYAIERYGDRVATNGRFHAMPWLMTPDELIEYVGKHGEVPGIISNPAQVRAVETALQEVLSKRVDMMMDVFGSDAGIVVLQSADIHRMAFEMVQQLSATTPWKKGLQRLSGRKAVDLWGSFWTGLVLINPAFVVSNAVDVPTKTLAFALSEKYAKKRYSKRAADAIVDAASIGHGERSQFFYGTGVRTARERVLHPYSLTDRIGGVWDGATGGIADHVLKPIEAKSKRELGRMLYDGMWDEFAESFLKGTKTGKFGANPQGLKLTEEQVDLLIKLRVKDRIKDLFPSLEDAGLGERLFNRMVPFISYNAKNRLLWTSWVLDHPWSIRLLQEAQGQLKAHNEREWAKEHGDAPMPESLSHQIQIGGTGFFLDIGMFTDAARGAEWITSSVKTIDGQLVINFDDVVDFWKLWVRPLPNQEALFFNALYDITDLATGRGFGGRYVWRKWIDPETGMWNQTGGPNGNGYIQDYVGPGTAWGDRRFDYVNNMFPFEGLRETVSKWWDGYYEANPDLFMRVIGNLMDFQEFGHVSETYSLYLIYNELLGPDRDNYDLAGDWLQNTPDGQRLTELWAQQYWDPDSPEKPFGNELHINEYATLFYDEDGNFKPPEDKEMRQRWLAAQPPDLADLVREANEKLFAMRDQFDQQLDLLDPTDYEGRQHLWKLRRALEGGISQEYPEVYAYYAFGQTPKVAYDHRMQAALDTQRQKFYDLFGWDKAPEGEEARAAWELRKKNYLTANPEFAASLADEYSTWQRSLNRVERTRDLAIANSEGAERIRTWAQARDMQGLSDAASTLIDYNSRAFGMEAAGYDQNGEFKFKRDSGWRKYLRGDDPAKVWYADAMKGVGQRAQDENGEFNINKWWRIINRNPELRAEYLEREGISGSEWASKGTLYEFHDRWSKAAEKGQWDKAWGLYESLDRKTMAYWEESNPKGFRERLRSYEYSNAMGRWVAYFDRGDSAGAMRYFDSLPKWMRDRYYENNPGKQYSKGQSSAYISMLNSMFDQIDAGNWDAAERIWNSAPAHMRSQYYASNPDSTLFRGKGKGGGISDAKFKQYTRAMGEWVDFLKDGKDAKAQNYFNGLPQWMKEFYYQNNPDKKFQMQNDKMFGLAAEYFNAEPGAQKAMLRRNPGLRRWLNENDTTAARANAIRYAYMKLPDDPWLKRVYREKYPEVFSVEAKGEQKKQDTFDIIGKYPEIADEWMKWYEDIQTTALEALKYAKPRPRQLKQDYSVMRAQRASRGRSAAETADAVARASARTPRYSVRSPRIS